MERPLCVHRKGATRALPPGAPSLPGDLAGAGQPVLAPGTMGPASYVMVGFRGNDAVRTAPAESGAVPARCAWCAAKGSRDQLEASGIAVRPSSWRGLAEEAPEAYEDVDAVAAAIEGAGLARLVARLVPLGVVNDPWVGGRRPPRSASGTFRR
ncbi:hypothetical protein KCMC57_up04870 [Kitasatospora sp. CMC57]|uniref:3'-phosphate/5'-hydroxy nucleic acid ligase n=1 Tax=Kitasatospora sp. CMC57 TaxID=3231513 RepID=A0AB33JXP2_9ACTN